MMRRSQKKSPPPSIPTNSGSPTPTPPVEYIKKELATFFPRTKDKRALAASSSAIALSIVSPSCNTNETAVDEPESSEVSVWKTAYGAARIAIETAKESSDMCPPLKAVLGALSVLIKNYDVSSSSRVVLQIANRPLQQTANNVERIKDIGERVESLSEMLTRPVGDQDTEEKARRESLKRFALLRNSRADSK
jgi:hypothetical protein